jgi:hypothetical protein
LVGLKFLFLRNPVHIVANRVVALVLVVIEVLVRLVLRTLVVPDQRVVKIPAALVRLVHLIHGDHVRPVRLILVGHVLRGLRVMVVQLAPQARVRFS